MPIPTNQSRSKLRATVVLAAGLLAGGMLAAGCQSSVSIVEAGSIGEHRSAIVNGVESSGYSAIGALVAGNGASACTATLIGSRTLLTAAHCVDNHWPVDFYIESLSGPRYTAASVSVHPGYGGGNIRDLAIVRLTQPVAGVEPLRLAEQAPRVGEVVTLVGYGKTGEGEGDFGTKRSTTSKVAKVFNELLTISGGEGNVCDGDSGGPTLVARDGRDVVVGVHSTKGAVCGQQGNDMRVDAFLDWILHESETGQLDADDHTPPTVKILSPARDARVGSLLAVAVAATDDGAVTKVVLRLDGQVADASQRAPYEFRLDKLQAGEHTIEVTAHDTNGNTASAQVLVQVVAANIDRAFGQPCAEANQCQSRVCTGDSRSGDSSSGGTTSGGAFCSRSCSISAPCGSGFACAEGLCQLSAELATYGEACDAAQHCAGNGLCAEDDITGERFCTQSCTLDAAGCPTGSSCLAAGNANLAVCVPDAAADGEQLADQAQGCSLGADAPAGSATVGLLIGLLALVRRRRRRR